MCGRVQGTCVYRLWLVRQASRPSTICQFVSSFTCYQSYLRHLVNGGWIVGNVGKANYCLLTYTSLLLTTDKLITSVIILLGKLRMGGKENEIRKHIKKRGRCYKTFHKDSVMVIFKAKHNNYLNIWRVNFYNDDNYRNRVLNYDNKRFAISYGDFHYESCLKTNEDCKTSFWILAS